MRGYNKGDRGSQKGDCDLPDPNLPEFNTSVHSLIKKLNQNFIIKILHRGLSNT